MTGRRAVVGRVERLGADGLRVRLTARGWTLLRERGRLTVQVLLLSDWRYERRRGVRLLLRR